MINTPLAERMRPKTLEDYVGQKHLLGEKGVVTQSIDNQMIPSMILWGPPGVGKTTLAHIIAETLECPFYRLSAINSGVKDIREIINKARVSNDLYGTKKPILFIDEIHRFSKSQQDSLLGAVEKGWVTLLGATTENPSFEVISALLSRCQVYVLYPFSKEDLETLLEMALRKDEILKNIKITIKQTEALFSLSGGDGRRLFNIIDLIVSSSPSEDIVVTDDLVKDRIQKNIALYDKSGEQHYDIISAFIKSIRGSDPNASVYWLARMIEGGEDVKFIARRLLILASEDIGNANPTALVLANSTFQSVMAIGYPEARIILSQCVIYLATSPKSNSSYEAISKAQNSIKALGALPVPIHLRNAPTKLMKDLEYGRAYKYSHNYDDNFVNQEFFPKGMEKTLFYIPGNNDKEQSLRNFLKNRWKDKYDY